MKQQLALITLSLAGITGLAIAQPPPDRFGGPGGFGGPPGGTTRKILKDYDTDKNGWLNNEERKVARAALKKDSGDRRGPRGGFGGRGEPASPGPHVEPGEVTNYPDRPLFDPSVLRTIFIQFENADWEKELEDFHGTDVDVACTLTVDGKTFPNVGVHFRGMSSYMGVSTGSKRSLNVSFDLDNRKQRLYGAKTLNLLNCHDDESFLSTVLYSQIAREYIPAPKANMVRVVINGESWGVYTNVQQFDKEFLRENYKTDKGTRWKVSGSPGGRGGLEYTGDDLASYKRIFEIKSKDDDKAWKALVNLCKVLKETPADKLEEALKPIVDIDNLLWFIALDITLINGDGYWTRASDYNIWLDDKGKFHFLPHDMNEAFRTGGPGGMMTFPVPGEILTLGTRDQLKLTDAQKKQLDALQKEVDDKLAKIFTEQQAKDFKALKDRTFGFGRGPGGPPGGGMGSGVKLDPMTGLTDERKPLRSKILAVPAFKQKYLANVRTIAEKSLDWKNLGTTVQQFRSLIEKEIEKDTKKLSSFDAFKRATDHAGESRSLKSFADQRRTYLLEVTKK